MGTAHVRVYPVPRLIVLDLVRRLLVRVGCWSTLMHWIGFSQLVQYTVILLGMQVTLLRVSQAEGQATPHPTDALGEERFALIIGINEYDHPNIPDLKYAESDARGVFEVLTNPDVGCIATEKAKLLLGKDATSNAIRRELLLLKRVPRDATVFIFFSGHGAKEGGESYWVTADAEYPGFGWSALPGTEIRRHLGAIPSNRVVVLLDCCYAAATVGSQKSIMSDVISNFSGTGYVTIAASGSGEEAIEADELSRGVFAHYLINGLNGMADHVGTGNGDGIVTVMELATFLDQTVAEEARKRGGIQKPTLFMEEVQEPSKFLLTIDPKGWKRHVRIQKEAAEKNDARLKALRGLFVDDKISGDQQTLGESLLSAADGRLSDADAEKRGIFIDLAEGTLPPKYLKSALEAVIEPVYAGTGDATKHAGTTDATERTIPVQESASDILVLNFVANCRHSKRQVPHVDRVRKRYEDKGVRFVNVVQTYRNRYQSQEEVVSVFLQWGSKLELAYDPDNIVGDAFGVTAYTTMVILDHRRQVVAINIPKTRDLEARLAHQLDLLLDGKAIPEKLSGGNLRRGKQPVHERLQEPAPAFSIKTVQGRAVTAG